LGCSRMPGWLTSPEAALSLKMSEPHVVWPHKKRPRQRRHIQGTIVIKPISRSPTPTEIADYRRDGVVLLRSIIAEDSIAILREGVEVATQSFPEKRRDMSRGRGGAYALNFIWRHVKQYEIFIKESGISRLAANFLGIDAVVFVEDELFVKSPGVYAPTPWHHDRPYYPVIGGSMCSVWIPLNPIEENSALELIAGSHQWGSEFLPLNFRKDGVVPGANEDHLPDGVQLLPDIEANRDKYRIVKWGMTPGDLLVFDGLTVHGNRDNQSQHTSQRVSFRFFSPDAAYHPTRYPWTRPLSEYGIDEPTPGIRLSGEDFPTL